MAKKKSCFVIGPIGDEGSEERIRSDQILKHIIRPAAEECGYKAVRADEISEPGIITTQIIDHLMNDDLVIADLTGHNPNVFYELAVRHAVRKPVVQMIAAGERIPFDVAAARTIQVDHHNLDSVEAAKEEMVKQIKAAESNPANVDTPLSTAIQIKDLKASENPLEKSYAEIIEMLQDIRGTLGVSPHEKAPSGIRNGLYHAYALSDDLRERQSDLRECLLLRVDGEDAQDMEKVRGLVDRIKKVTSLLQGQLREIIETLPSPLRRD